MPDLHDICRDAKQRLAAAEESIAGQEMLATRLRMRNGSCEPMEECLATSRRVLNRMRYDLHWLEDQLNPNLDPKL